MFYTKDAEKIKTHILCSKFLFENLVFYKKKCGNCCRIGQTTDGKMGHAHCMLDN